MPPSRRGLVEQPFEAATSAFVPTFSRSRAAAHFSRWPRRGCLREEGLVEWRYIGIVNIGIRHAVNSGQVALDRFLAHDACSPNGSSSCSYVQESSLTAVAILRPWKSGRGAHWVTEPPCVSMRAVNAVRYSRRSSSAASAPFPISAKKSASARTSLSVCGCCIP
jgi:hypothetical protein